MPHRISQTRDWLGGHDLVVLIGFFIIAAGTLAFVVIADNVRDGDTENIDVRILESLVQGGDRTQRIGPAWLPEVGRDITALGGYAFLILLVTGVSIFLRLDDKHREMWFVLGAVIGGYALMMALKALAGRERPDLVEHLSVPIHSSFPSGHAMMSAITFLTLGVLLAHLTPSLALKFYFLACALFLTLAVGVSRVYMGVHYPSDVLAGWTGGIVWSTLCSLVARWLLKRGTIQSGM
jgi:undecaprenyl-diphosphatase